MTTNIERAGDLIADATIPPGTSIARGVDRAVLATKLLADDGLLMPDLPEPEMVDGRTVWRVDEEGFVYIKPNGWITTIGVETPYDSPRIAYRHALALLAAADHAEQEQDND